MLFGATGRFGVIAAVTVDETPTNTAGKPRSNAPAIPIATGPRLLGRFGARPPESDSRAQLCARVRVNVFIRPSPCSSPEMWAPGSPSTEVKVHPDIRIVALARSKLMSRSAQIRQTLVHSCRTAVA
jgi:hypothetical protein